MRRITKTQFLKFRDCPREFWLKEHHPEEFKFEWTEDAKFRASQGREVEKIAKPYIAEINDAPAVYERTVTTDRLQARLDVFVESADGDSSHIYEIKSSKFIDPANTRKKAARLKRLYDIGFQVFAARESGIEISKAFLVTLNGEYRLGDVLNVEEILKIEDVTDDVEELQTEIGETISEAFDLLDSEPGDGFDDLCSKKLSCEYFEFKMPDLQNPTIFNIPRLNKKIASQLLSIGVFDIEEIPEEFPLTDTQKDYVEFMKGGEKQIDKDAIADRLDELEYPLYFLDYETVNPAIPQFEGMSPLQHITFQYSLHILESLDSELKHREFLSDGTAIPPRNVARELSAGIGETGSVLVWYKSFEMGRNREMAKLYPEFADFMESVNERVFDLYEIFSKNLYRNPALKNNSIKSVLPAMAPHLNYDELEIAHGTIASSRWYAEVYSQTDLSQKTDVMKALRDYCKMDTLAMVEILKVLQNL